MEFQELGYQKLTVPELLGLDTQFDKQIWDTMDLLHALRIGQATVRNTLQEKNNASSL